jgi:hypothetical protein
MIVEAVGIAVSTAGTGPKALEHKKQLEDAMMFAVKKAQAEGIVDNDVIRERMLEARDEVLNKGNT